MKIKKFTTNKLALYFIIIGLFLSVIACLNLWTTEYNSIVRSFMSAEKEINARLETAASISRILSEQMEKNITYNGNDIIFKKLDIHNDNNNNYWYSDIKSEISNEEKSMGVLSGIGDYRNIDDNVKKEISSALNLQINFSGTAYKKTYSWIYYLSNDKFIYIYPKVSHNVYHLTDKSYKKISWKYADRPVTQMTEPYLDAAGTGYVIAFFSSVYAKEKFKGVVGVEINLNYITKLIRAYGVAGDYYVITNDGVIVNSSNSQLLGKNSGINPDDIITNKVTLGIGTTSNYKLHIVNPAIMTMVLKSIYLHLILTLGLNATFLYALYLIVRYFITRNEITTETLIYALKHNQFVPYAQPVVSTESGEVVGCEILIRWIHPVKGIIPPDAFISLSETSGVIIPMTHHLMDKVSHHFIKNIKKLPANFHIAINICPNHIAEESLLKHCQLFIKNLKDKVELVLEITERSNFDVSSENMKKKITMLLKAGVRFSLDDFGTGYSTHAYIQKIQVEYIKIDRSFTKMIGMDEISHHIVTNVVNLAENINAKIVAEGVETIEQAIFLKNKKIPYQQGYLYGKPVPLEEFTSLYF